jgi:hypothetical protein
MNMDKQHGNVHHICNAFCLPHSVILCMQSVNMVAMMICQPFECCKSNHMKLIRVRLYGVTNITNTRKTVL